MPLSDIAALQRRAGAAVERGAYQEAVDLLASALELSHRLQSEDTARSISLALRLDLRRPLLALHQYAEVGKHLRIARDLALDGRETLQVAVVDSYLAHLYWRTGDQAAAVQAAQHALEQIASIDGEGDDLAVTEIETLFRLGKILNAVGLYGEAITSFETCIASLERGLTVMPTARGDPEITIRAWIVWCYAELGAFRNGIRYGRHAVRQAFLKRDDYAAGFSLLALGNVLLAKGEATRAIQYLRRGHALGIGPCEGSDILTPRYLSSLGAAYAHLGWFDQAIPMLEQAVAWIGTPESGGPSGWLGRLAAAYMMVDRLEEAHTVAERALALSEQRNERGYEAWSHKILGDIVATSHTGVSDHRCVDEYHKASRLAEELRMRPLVAHCDLALGRHYLALDQPQSGRFHIESAAQAFRAMGMRYWLAECHASSTARAT